MREHDFLTPFERELEQEAFISHKLEGAELEKFEHMMTVVQQQNEEWLQHTVAKTSPQKREQFEKLYPLLVYLSKENGVRLRVYDEDDAVIRVELKFSVIMGGTGPDGIHGSILAEIFDVYRDFSLELSTDNHILLKFNVPLIDRIPL